MHKFKMTVLYIAYRLLNHAYYVPVADMLENEIKNYLKLKKFILFLSILHSNNIIFLTFFC